MTSLQALVALGGALTGLAIGAATARLLASRPPARLLRDNYRKRRLPVVLGIAVVAGGSAGLGAVLLAERNLEGVALHDVGPALLAIVVLLGVGGAVDDLRGDESARGFKGHLRAALTGRLTGGAIKIVTGGAAGLIAGFLVTSRVRFALEIAVLVPLSANLVNLLDRSPGRAAKVSLAAALPLFPFGSAHWVLASAGTWGALLATLPFDLRERAMLGDAGANVVGGVLGFGLGLSFAEPGRMIALGFVLGLNVASEAASFSQVIERNKLLRWLDHVGRAE